MHECPDCGQACTCDGDDTWFENVTYCVHDCDDFDGDDEYDREEAEFWGEP